MILCMWNLKESTSKKKVNLIEAQRMMVTRRWRIGEVVSLVQSFSHAR